MINDTQGHAVGDMVLSQTGSILSEVTGDRGIVGRLGGDEFAVFASGFQNSVEMEEFCVSLRENLKRLSLIWNIPYLSVLRNWMDEESVFRIFIMRQTGQFTRRKEAEKTGLFL